MGHPARLDTDHGWHHVMNRGTRKWTIFLDDRDRHRFISLLGKAAIEREVRIVAFALMGNHFHLVAYCPKGGLSEFMRDVQSSFARAFNHYHGYNGAVFGGRYKSKLITSDEYLATAVRYVHRNPLELPNCPEQLVSYRWSSYPIHCGLRPAPKWLDRGAFENACPWPISQLRTWTETPLPTDKVQNQVPTVGVNSSVSDTELLTPGLSDIRRAVASAAGVDVGDVRTGKRNGLIGVAALLAREIGGFDCSEMCDALGFRNPDSVRSTISQTRKRLKEDSSLEAICGLANSSVSDTELLAR